MRNRKSEEAAALATPIPNSYWVEPGRLLAGEYPGALSTAEAVKRIEQFLKAGVTSFIDLTEEEELPPYAGLWPAVVEQRIHHKRLSIRDHDVPETAATVSRILDAIDAELAAGRTVYIHCRAGIGRTGTVVACYLMRRGLVCERALDRLQVLWKQCARSHSWPRTPETPEQLEFVQGWSEPPPRAPGRLHRPARFEGALVGLAVGDGLGMALTRATCGAAALGDYAQSDNAVLAPGADTAMTLCVAESLLAREANDAGDQMQRYQQWMRGADAAAIPADFKRALAAWQWSKKPTAGSHDPRNLDPHSLARSLGVALWMVDDPRAAIEAAVDVSRTTQQSPVVLDACRLWTALLIDAFCGVERAALAVCGGPLTKSLRERALKPQVSALMEGRWQSLIDTGVDAVSLLAIVLSEFAAARPFSEGVIRVATAASLPHTAAALYGSLAGAHAGIDAVPLEWRHRLLGEARITLLAHEMAAL